MAIGKLRHVVTFQAPGGPAPDGDGGYIDTWIDLDPPKWSVEIRPATVRDLERAAAGTVIATSTHVIAGRYRPDVTIESRVRFNTRTFTITGIKNVDERGIQMELFATEML